MKGHLAAQLFTLRQFFEDRVRPPYFYFQSRLNALDAGLLNFEGSRGHRHLGEIGRRQRFVLRDYPGS